MTTKHVVRIIVMLLAISTAPAASSSGKRQETDQLVITGRVVAYDQLISLSNITSAPALEVLLVRVEARLKGREDSSLIKVKYEYMGDDLKLPIGVLDSKNKWRFALVRDKTCDGSLRKLQETKPEAESEMSLPHFKSTKGAETDEIPLDENIPCYVLRHGSLSPLRSNGWRLETRGSSVDRPGLFLLTESYIVSASNQDKTPAEPGPSSFFTCVYSVVTRRVTSATSRENYLRTLRQKLLAEVLNLYLFKRRTSQIV